MKYFILPALFVALMSSCRQEYSDNFHSEKITLDTRVSTLGDEAAETEWYKGDTIGVFLGAEPSRSLFLFAYDGDKWEALRAMTKEEMNALGSDAPVEAYTPWGENSSVTSVALPVVDGVVNQSTPEKLADSDFLYSVNSSYSATDHTLNLDFAHRLSQLRVIYAYSATVQDVAPSDVLILNQPCVYTYTDNVWAADGASSAVSVAPYTVHAAVDGEPQDVKGQMTAVLVPHKFIKGTEIMRFKIADKEYSVTAPVDIEFKPGKSVTFNIAVGEYDIESLSYSFSNWQEDYLGSGVMTE